MRSLHLGALCAILCAIRVVAEFTVSKTLAISLLLAFAIPSQAQRMVPPDDIAAVNQLIDAHARHNSLNCFIESWGPSLDFEFRYEAGFQAAINMNQLRPGERVMAYLRVTPQGASPVFLEHFIHIPAHPHDSDPAFLISGNRRRFRLTGSGRFTIGQGRYAVELVLLSEDGHSCERHWKLQTGKYPDGSAPAALPPLAVESVRPVGWDGGLRANGIRLSVLLDAAPQNPFAARLHPEDRAFTLEALAAVLKELPCESVQVVAFNLDEQRDVFRDESFGADGFAKLAFALQSLELSTVPVGALRRGNNIEYLRHLARKQLASGQFDAVIFLGPNLQTTYANPQIRSAESTSTRLFYFEGYTNAFFGAAPRPYIGAAFPDSIEYLTKELHGSVFHIESAKDLAAAIPKMLAQLRSAEAGQSPSHGN
jgi:hypothetical protein